METIRYRVTVRFKDTNVLGEEWFNDAPHAWEAFWYYTEPDGYEIYNRIELTEVNEEEHQDYTLAILEYPVR